MVDLPMEIEVTTSAGVPMRILAPVSAAFAPAVILLHGLGGNRTTHTREAYALASSGLAAVLLDAPHHGARPGSLLAEMAAAPRGQATHALFLRLVDEAAREVPSLVDCLLSRGHPSVALAGISLGGFTALAAAADDVRLAATACMLASPEWWSSKDPIPDELATLVARSPARRPGAFAPRPLALFTAGKDQVVPPAATRRFTEALRPYYAAVPDRLVYREYPESEHMMRPEDWEDVWSNAIPFLQNALL